MTHFVKVDGHIFMAIPFCSETYMLEDGRNLVKKDAIRDHDAEEAYETIKNKVPAVVAYLSDKKCSVFQKPDGTYSAWIKGAEVGQSPNPVLALLVAGIMAMEHEGFDGWSDDPHCIAAMNNLDDAVIRGYHCKVWLDTNKTGQYYYCMADGEIRDWDANPVIALISGLIA